MKKQKAISDKVYNELIDAMKQAKKQKNTRMYERYQTVLMHLRGNTYEKISQVNNLSMRTISTYVSRFHTQGLDGLKMATSSGRPTKLTTEQDKILIEVITEKTPEDVGFPAELNWTAPLICKYIEKEFQVVYSVRGTRSVLYRLGFSFTMPAYTLAKADPEKQEAFKKEFERLKKTTF